MPRAQAAEIDGVVEYIISNTRNREPVFAFSDLGIYNFLTDRPPVGRFYSAELSFMDQAWFQELFLELENKKPRFVICARSYLKLAPLMSNVGAYLDKIDSYLKKNYEIKKSFPTVNVLERKM